MTIAITSIRKGHPGPPRGSSGLDPELLPVPTKWVLPRKFRRLRDPGDATAECTLMDENNLFSQAQHVFN